MFNDFISKLVKGGVKKLPVIGGGIAALSPMGNAANRDTERLLSEQFARERAGAGAAPQQQQPIADTGGGGYYGGGGYAAAQPQIDLSPYRNEVRDRVNQINSIYNQLYGDLDRVNIDERNRINTDTERQIGDANTAFERGSEQTNQAYAARGLSSSDYLTSAQDANRNVYKSNIDNLTNTRENAYAKIGQAYNQGRTKLDQGRSQVSGINPDAMGDVNSLVAQRDALDQSIRALQQERAGTGTLSEFANVARGLNAGQQQVKTQLSENLQKLISSSANRFAKDEIAKGLINSSQLDEKSKEYFMDYYSNLLSAATPPKPILQQQV